MDAITAYVAKSILASGLLFGYYCLALRNKKFNVYNRFYLLASIVLSLVLPLLKFTWLAVQATPNTAAGQVFILIGAPNKAQVPVHFSPVWLAYAAASIISLALCIILTLEIAWIYRMKKKHGGIRVQGVNLIEVTVKQAPFSFLNNLFWKKGISLQQPEGEKIFRHELAHIQQRHTYDKLFAQAVTCIFWMNPFYWLIQKELGMIHEFIADAASIEDGDVDAFARMLLQSHNGGRYLSPEHQFFHSPIKRRLIMLTTSAKTSYSYARRVLALPVAAIIAVLFSVIVGNAQTVDPKLQPLGSIKPDNAKIERNPADSTITISVPYKDKSGKLKKRIFKMKYMPGAHDEGEMRIMSDSLVQKSST
ncbi:Signal transducer regulating beta-lactamase production, contains metallopeptidase domain [Chitinophaga rupis]|uniref:Signal transducer regulating beta-lactamase production, contains metallopeptidase domain n=1 Tax=Chitinophaga rupis TaxID=573321 RepID=A0A1H7YKN2_9BACT|nr:M56 family metallopeptidase [Chitinophaga rupis]SEM45837.1 Signal transducer regulating beta-lactamase production, contains metallopeptidase domain [Chitinophaga rupis]